MAANRPRTGDRAGHSMPVNYQSRPQIAPLTRANLAASDSPRPSSVGSAQSTHSSTKSAKGGSGRGRHHICVGEEVKIAVDIALERFRLSEEQTELEFPSSLTSTERAYIHRLCASMGLKSKSKGKGQNRYLTVTKKDSSLSAHSASGFNLARNSRHQIQSLLQRFPVTNKERQDLQPRTERGQYNDGALKELSKATTGRLNNGVPQVPPARGQSDLNAFRQTLPVSLMKEEIIKAIVDNKVVLISGETGSGKTTQVPQMILDEGHANNKPCRIFCTQPRRISALSVAERVAAERGEKVGQTVGYQIRLESRVSPKTLLVFCTNGVLLRTLMGGDNALNTVTHIIVDEIHERDRFSDFLLIALRDLLPRYKNLRLVLMSAALNIQLFATYYNMCPVISIPGKLFNVKEYFLEDILKLTGYTNKEMQKYKIELEKVSSQQKVLDDWTNKPVTSEKDRKDSDNKAEEEYGEEEEQKAIELGQEKEDLEPWLITEMDQLLSQGWLTGEEDIFTQIFHLIMSENVTVDYIHSGTSVTPLMIASGRGFLRVVEQLLNLGANVHIRASNDWTALDWARKFDRNDVIELLEAHITATELAPRNDESLLVKTAQSLTPEDRELLNIYHHSFDDEKVDLDLIMALLTKIHTNQQEGAVLVFLPGYDEIVGLRDRIYDDKRFSDSNKFILYTLHSNMQSTDQKRVFRNPPSGVRKIILSTNIAETSVTINDVVFVIDSGKVKEKSFDALTSASSLKSRWVSKASALQRKGRAGRCRPGECFHLFSHVRYDSMQEYQDPELLRYPLQELCLHTKLLAPVNCPIADFLAKAPEPPAFLITRNAVHLLKQIDALDPFEEMTELGHHLADLPVEPRYGKMVLYSVVLKCLDPVLTISCALAYRDPFILPAQPYQKRAAAVAKRKFSAGTFSDHMALLRAFQSWQRARTEGWEKPFCDKNFLSAATMEMIVGMRTQLLGQLRASGFVRARGGGDIRDLNTNSENWAVVKAALVAGMYPHVIRVDRNRLVLTTVKENKVRFHGSSVLGPAPNLVGSNTHAQAVNKVPTDWLVYEEMTRAHRLAQARCCTAVSPMAVTIFAGPAKLGYDVIREAENRVHAGQGDGFPLEGSSDSEGDEKEDGKRANVQIDDWLTFRTDAEGANMAMQLRQKWHSLFIRRMRAPSKPWSQVDESVIRAVIAVLTNEEQSLGLQQPAGIGQRPRPMSTESLMSGGGGSRRGSYDTEYSDDSSSNSNNYDNKQHTPKGRPFKISTSPKKREMGHGRGFEDKSETSSVRSSSSTPGSAGNSLRGSASSSPCCSPQPTSPTKWSERDAAASAAHPCRYFVMKSNSHKNLDVAYQKGIWATTTINEKKLARSLQDGKAVYLIFSVQGSGHFQGVAKMNGVIRSERAKEFSAPGLGATFSVDWVKRANLPFQQCHHLLNSWNENKKVQVSRDGQEIEPNIGEALVKLWDRLQPYQPRTPPYGHRFGPRQFLDGHHGNQPHSQAQESDHNYHTSPGQGRGFDSGRGHDGRGRNYHGGNYQHGWSSGDGHGQPYGRNQGQWSGRHGRGGYSHAQTNPTQSMTMPQMSSGMGPPFNHMYPMGPMMHQGQMGNPMFPSGNQSPGQNMSPVMILQRGSQPPGQGGGSNSSGGSQGPHGSPRNSSGYHQRGSKQMYKSEGN